LHLPLQYDSLVSRVRREAEAVSSLKTLMNLNQLSEDRLQRQHLEMAMAIQQDRQIARRLDSVSVASHLLSSSSTQQGPLYAQQHRTKQQPLLPPNSLLPVPEMLFGRAKKELLSSLPSNRASNPIEKLLLQRNRSLPEKKVSFIPVSEDHSKISEIRNLVANAAAGIDEPQGTLSRRPSDEKVKAALRSQPQRGRKRLNLSTEERVELTKTRNREHARNTRMRKKARYTDLLKCERQLESFVRAHELESDRLQCLKHFISARENMINEAPVADVSEEIRDRFANDIVQDFEFETKGLPSVFECKDSSPISRMSHWDKQLRSKVFGSTKMPSSTFFAYEPQGGVDGIAISKNGSSYTQFDVVLYQMHRGNSQELPLLTRSSTSTPPLMKEMVTEKNGFEMHKIVLLKILMKAQFGVDRSSSKLASMVWTVLEDQCGLESQK